MRFLLVFLGVPILEIALFVQVGGQIGVLGTLAEIFATAAFAIVLIRLEPQRSVHDVRAALERDASPASPMAHSALRLIGAVLLLLPGFFTDAVGLLLLIPPVRTLMLGRMVARLGTARHAQRGSVIEGEYETAPGPHQQPRSRLPEHEPRDRENRD